MALSRNTAAISSTRAALRRPPLPATPRARSDTAFAYSSSFVRVPTPTPRTGTAAGSAASDGAIHGRFRTAKGK
ncbi:hypothetical protein [Streptomyces sp. NPDC003327]